MQMIFLAYMVFALCLYFLLSHGKYWRPNFLKHLGATSREIWPDVVAVVPARNEADVLETTLPTLLGHDYPALKVMLVDDASEDATAEVAGRIGNEYPTSYPLSIVNSRPREGWRGKVVAMQCGLDYVTTAGNLPRYVLFTDADIAYDKTLLKRLVAHAESGNYVLTSLMAKLHCKSNAERWLIPPFVYFFQQLYPFRWVNSSKHGVAAAAGGCMLVRYDALKAAGGFERIHTALIDDCALARLMKKHGRIWLGLTEQVKSVRTYPRVRDVCNMVARSAYDQLQYSPLNLLAVLLAMMFVYVVPVLFTVFGHREVWLLGVMSYAYMSFTYLPMVRFYRLPRFFCLTLPIAAIGYMAFTLYSAWRHVTGRGSLWKGRVATA